MKSILILGSEGFIGNQLTKYFLEKGYAIAGCDLFESPRETGGNYFQISRLYPEWEEIFSKHKFDYCINAAGNGNPNYSMTQPLFDFESNTLDTVRLLDIIRNQNSACKYLHISSAAVYGNPVILPVKEDSKLQPLSPYGWHKLMSEQVCNEYSNIFQIQTAVVRPFSVYGPGLKKQLFWDVYQKILVNKEHIELWGTGNESRDFIYIEDLAHAIETVMGSISAEFQIFNVASGIETTIQEAINIFIQTLGSKTTVEFNQRTREGDPINWRADISAIKKLGFEPKLSLKEGLEQVGKWFLSL